MTNQTNSRTVFTVTDPALVASTAPEIIKRTVQQALNLLAVAGTEYIIRLSDGTTLTKGTLELVTRKKVKYTKKPRKMPYGAMRNWVAPQIAHLLVGDVAEVALTDEMKKAGVILSDLMSSVSSTANKLFGLESHKVCTNKKTERIEILRTA